MNNQKPIFDAISFALGGLLCSLLSISITVYFINSVGFLFTLAKLTIVVFLVLCVLMALYLIKRGEIWTTLIGKNLHSAQENLAESVKALLPGYSLENSNTITQKDAVQNLAAIYGDYQVRRFIIFCVLAVFGAISALVTAAFLIKQTMVMDKQTVVMDQQSKTMDKQTQFAIDIAKTESLYKPYWDLKHSDSIESRRAAFTKLLNQQETSNFNGIRLDEIDFSPTGGSLSVSGFQCKSCNFKDVQLGKIEWTGNFLINNSFLRQTTFRAGTMNRPVFDDVHISNLGTDEQGNSRRTGFLEAININNFVFRNSVLNNARVMGFPARNLNLIDIEDFSQSMFNSVIFNEVPVFVNIDAAFFYAANSNFSALGSGFNTTLSGRSQFRVSPLQREGFLAFAC